MTPPEPAIPAPPILVWVVEDHERFATQLQRLVDGEDDMECPHRFGSAADLFRQLQASSTRPDVLTLDIGLPGMSGLDILSEVRAALPGIRMMILSSSDEREKIYTAICNGASGYLLKNSEPEEILDGIREVARGAAPLSPEVAGMILQGFARLGPVGGGTEPLTPREEEVLRHLVKGLIKKEIADALTISLHTVDMHLRAIYRKLHVRTQTEAVSVALRQGLV